MSATSNAMPSSEDRAAMVDQARAIHDAKLRALLEPIHNNEYVAIHVDTEDYSIGRTFREASHELQERHPRDGRMVGWKIGPEPDTDFLARMVAAEAG